MTNLKDTVTSICSLAIAITGAIIIAANTGMIILDAGVVNICMIVGVTAGAVIGWLSGKNPDGSTKTSEQISAQQNPK